MRYLSNFDFNLNQLLNVLAQKLASPPIGPKEGQFYYDTTLHKLRYYDGGGWINADASDASMTGEDIIAAINASLAAIDDDNLSKNVRDTINKAHKHLNADTLDKITAAFTTEQAAKLESVEERADVTDAENVGNAINSSNPKTTLLDSDIVAILNSSSLNVLSNVTWANLKATLKTYTDTLYNKYSHPTGDGNLHVPAIGASNSGKVLTAGATAGSMSWKTPSVSWANVADKPTSAVSDIDLAVTNKHTHANRAILDTYKQTESDLADAVSKKHSHSNKSLLDTYTQKEVDLADAVNKKHAQNTDTGTSSQTFAIGNAGVRVKNNGGTELQVRNSADNDFADIRVKNLYIEGDTTQINSNVVNIGDNELELNSDLTKSVENSDGGISIKRLKDDNITRADAKLTFNNSTGKWQTTAGNVSAELVTAQIANKLTATIGDGSTTTFTINHRLNTRNVSVSIRQTSAPYELVMTDIEFTTLDTITVKFAVAPAINEFTVTIIG
jgi:hypothetical protein